MPKGVHSNHVRGSRHYRYRGGISVSSHGYLKVQVGKTHPLADPNGYAYLHNLIAVSALGRRLEPNEIVHHQGDKFDNRWEQLVVETRGAHAGHHAGGVRDPETGRFAAKGGPTHSAGGRSLDGRTWDEMPRMEARSCGR